MTKYQLHHTTDELGGIFISSPTEPFESFSEARRGLEILRERGQAGYISRPDGAVWSPESGWIDRAGKSVA